MVNRPSVPEIITVNSEELQTQIRDLLPSQNGFGSELQATNVITPIIDLTRAAEGSSTPELLQTALAFGSQTAFSANNSTVVIANATGFYRIFVGFGMRNDSTTESSASLTMTDGLSVKTIFDFTLRRQSSDINHAAQSLDFVVFLAAGESISAVSNSTAMYINGSVRQIATGNGTLVSPNGFPV